MTKKPRTRTPSAGMEAALLEAAGEILETEGPDALSVRRIAAAAGVGAHGRLQPLRVEVRHHRGPVHPGLRAPVRSPAGGGRRRRTPTRRCAKEDAVTAPSRWTHPMVYQLMFLRTVPGFEPSDHALEVAGRCVRQPGDRGAAGHGRRGDRRRLSRPRRRNSSGRASMAGCRSSCMGIGFVEDQQAGFDRVCSTMLDGLSPEAVRLRPQRSGRRAR